MGVIEGFATIILENEQEVQKSHNTYLFQFYLIIIALRLFFVFVVWKFLWSQEVKCQKMKYHLVKLK